MRSRPRCLRMRATSPTCRTKSGCDTKSSCNRFQIRRAANGPCRPMAAVARNGSATAASWTHESRSTGCRRASENDAHVRSGATRDHGHCGCGASSRRRTGPLSKRDGGRPTLSCQQSRTTYPRRRDDSKRRHRAAQLGGGLKAPAIAESPHPVARRHQRRRADSQRVRGRAHGRRSVERAGDRVSPMIAVRG